MKYAPYKQAERRIEAESIREALSCLKRLSQKRNAADLDILRGVIALYNGNYEAAVKYFDFAAQSGAQAPDLLNDLAVAHLADFAETASSRSLFLALEASSLAIAEDPSLKEAYFNQALAFGKLKMISSARKKWSRYLALERHSRWREDAYDGIKELNSSDVLLNWNIEKPKLFEAALLKDRVLLRQIIKRYPQLAKEYSLEELLGQWSELLSSGNVVHAERYLSAAQSIGRELSVITSDRMVEDSVLVIEEIQRKGDSRLLEELRIGHSSYWRCRKAYDKFDLAEAEKSARSGMRHLGEANSPLSLWSSLHLAGCQYRKGNYQASEMILNEIMGSRKISRYPSLRGRCLWFKGLMRFVTGKWDDALALYRDSLESFRFSKEDGNSATLHYLLAENLEFIGEGEESQEHLYRALKLSSAIREPERRQMIFHGAAFFQSQRAAVNSAMLLQDEAVNYATYLGVPEGLAEALATRASYASLVNKLDAAREDIRRARRFSAQISSPEIRLQVEADIALKEGGIKVQIDPRNAIVELSHALAAHSRDNYKVFLADLYGMRAQAFFKTGAYTEAERDLVEGIRVLVRESGFANDLGIQTRVVQQMADLNSRLASLRYFLKGDSNLAFSAIDSYRLWRISGQYPMGQSGESDGIQPLNVAHHVPEDGALLEYEVVGDYVLGWCILRNHILSRVMPVKASELAALIHRSVGGEGWQFDSKEVANDPSVRLHDALIAPFDRWIEGKDLIVVPGDRLSLVPFSALRSRETMKFLIEDHSISVLPSASTLWAIKGRLGLSSNLAREKIVAIGRPAVNIRLFPEIADLPGAEKEARFLSSILPGVQLSGKQATRSNLVKNLNGAKVLHFGVHAVPNDRIPSRSFLLLAPEQRYPSGALFAEELKKLPLDSVQLVVLAGCKTGSSAYKDVYGMGEFVRMFLGAGVPMVIATLHDVDDAAASKLVERFYRYISAGFSPQEALRKAQREEIDCEEIEDCGISVWGSFVAFGVGIER